MTKQDIFKEIEWRIKDLKDEEYYYQKRAIEDKQK